MTGPERRRTVTVDVGGVLVGSARPVVVQSMTNTDTADVAGTIAQVRALARRRQRAGPGDRQQRRGGRGRCPTSSARWTSRSSATSTTTATCSWRSIPPAHARSPSTASTPATSAPSTATRTSRTIVRIAIDHGKPVRIGVNWGSLDQHLLTEMMDANAKLAEPRDART